MIPDLSGSSLSNETNATSGVNAGGNTFVLGSRHGDAAGGFNPFAMSSGGMNPFDSSGGNKKTLIYAGAAVAVAGLLVFLFKGRK